MPFIIGKVLQQIEIRNLLVHLVHYCVLLAEAIPLRVWRSATKNFWMKIWYYYYDNWFLLLIALVFLMS